MKCKRCYSYAINHHNHGRDGSGEELCDVCYWRNIAETRLQCVKECERYITGLKERTLWLEKRINQFEKTLKTANSQAEHFEREWYLRGDKIELLEEAAGLALGYASKGDFDSADEVLRRAKEANREC